jgi:hypothetical protein
MYLIQSSHLGRSALARDRGGNPILRALQARMAETRPAPQPSLSLLTAPVRYDFASRVNFRTFALFSCLLTPWPLLAADAPDKPAEAADTARWPELLTGKWKFEEIADSHVIDQISTIHKDGRVETVADIFVEGEPQRTLVLELRWKLSGDKLSYEVTKSSLPELKAVGDKWDETVTAVTNEEFRYRNKHGVERIEKRLSGKGFAQDRVVLSQPDHVLRKRVKDVKAFAGYIKELQDVCERQLKDETAPANLEIVVLYRPDGQAKTWVSSNPTALREKMGVELRKELDAIAPPKSEEGPVAFAIVGTVAGGVPHAAPRDFPTPKEWVDLMKERESLDIPDGFADLVLPPKP